MAEPASAASVAASASDLALAQTPAGFRLMPCSTLGMLWLQTHFEAPHWGALAAGQVRVDPESGRQLRCDAEAAGLKVARLAI